MIDELMQGKLEGYGRGARQRAGPVEVITLPYLKCMPRYESLKEADCGSGAVLSMVWR